MDGENKKRKMINDIKEEEEEEEDEEEKVKKFFALIKKAGEARKHIIKTNEQERNKIKPWKPAFEPQDFIEGDTDHQKLKEEGILMAAINAKSPGPSKRKKEPKEDEDNHHAGLDLNLSL
ncbi:protein NIM1-INTERACTING 1 [Impatiens glandulifera]|uniref:protein NIM1-INTERACTING 1 n=1 Tax=Impatiens glandulifera TaxID=253017 RepID=UPI001FB19C28|nr:protein NIM1-INTERACTING 1 [Impatiens glandulifera]